METAVYVDDLDQAETFYRDLLGLEILGREPGRHVFFRVGEGMLLVFNPQASLQGELLPAHGMRGAGHFALGVRAQSLDEWKSWLTRNGIVIEQEVTWPRGGRSLYFRDPAGNLVELLTPGLWGLPSGW